MAQSIPNLLRPGQATALQDEVSRLEHALTQPHLQDRPAATRALKHTQHQLETLSPQPYADDEKDAAVRRINELQTKMVEDGMPTRREMRANMPGAVGKLKRWERLHKKDLEEWKHRRLRMYAGTDDPDVANFERHRPSGGGGELSMDGAQIVPKDFYFGPNAGHSATVMGNEEIAVLREASPDAADALSTMDGETRAQLKAIVRELMEEKAFDPSVAPVEAAGEPSKRKVLKPHKKQEWSPERRKAFGEKMKAAREAKAAAA